MLCVSFNVELSEELVSRLFNAKYRLVQSFLLLTLLKYDMKKLLKFFVDI